MCKIYLNPFSLLVVTTALLWPTVFSEPTLNLVSYPDSLHFSQSEPIKSSSLADFLSLSLGYSLPKPLEWKGLNAITDLFWLAKVSLTVRINGHINIDTNYKFPIIETTNIDNQFNILSERTKNRFADNNRIIFKIDSQKNDYINQLSANQLLNEESDQQIIIKSIEKQYLHRFLSNDKLNKNDPNIRGLIVEIEKIRQILDSLKQLKTSDQKLPKTVLWFDINYFGHIINDKSIDQSVKEDTIKLLTDLFEELRHDLLDIYENRLLFAIIEDEPISPVLVRKVRSSEENFVSDTKSGNYSDLNLAHDFDPNFHTAFAMIGFTTILIAISVFGISVSMWNLDPGKDSIIYRMTSQRIKKDQ